MEIKPHPVYTNYGATEEGLVYNIKKNKILSGHINLHGYKDYTLGKNCHMGASRFIYECFNGVIEDGYEIDHIDNNHLNNKLANLQKLTKHDNNMKKYIDGYKPCKKDSKRVEATNTQTNVKVNYRSMSGASKVLNICGASIRRVCEGVYKTAISKTDGVKYSFKYIE